MINHLKNPQFARINHPSSLASHANSQTPRLIGDTAFDKLIKESFREIKDSGLINNVYPAITRLFKNNISWPQSLYTILNSYFHKNPFEFKKHFKKILVQFISNNFTPGNHKPYNHNEYLWNEILVKESKDLKLRIKTEFNKLNQNRENIHNAIVRNFKSFVSDQLKRDIKRENLTFNDLGGFDIINHINEFWNKSNILGLNFKQKLSNIFKLDTKEIDFNLSNKNFDKPISEWIANQFKKKKEFYLLYKSEIAQKLSTHIYHKVLYQNIKKAISLELAEQIVKKSANTHFIDNLNKLIPSIKYAFQDYGFTNEDINVEWDLIYNQPNLDNGELWFTVKPKNITNITILHSSISFYKNIPLQIRLENAIDKTLDQIKNNPGLRDFIQESNIDKNTISAITSLKDVQDVEDQQFVSIQWDEIINVLIKDRFNNPQIKNVEKLFNENFTNIFDGDNKFEFKYQLQIDKDNNVWILFNVIQKDKSDNFIKEFNFKKQVHKKEASIKYISFISRLKSIFQDFDFDPKNLSYIWINQLLDPKFKLSTIINQELAFKKISLSEEFRKLESRLKQEIEYVNNYRQTVYGSAAANDFEFNRLYKIDQTKLNSQLVLILTDHKRNKNYKKLWELPLSNLKSAEHIPRGKYKEQNEIFKDLISYLKKLEPLRDFDVFPSSLPITPKEIQEVPDLGERLNPSEYKLYDPTNGSVIFLQDIVNKIKNEYNFLGPISISPVISVGENQSAPKKFIEIKFSTIYNILNMPAPNNKMSVHSVLIKLEIDGQSPLYIENQKQKVIDSTQPWQKLDKDLMKQIDKGYQQFKNSDGSYRNNVSKNIVDIVTDYLLSMVKEHGSLNKNLKDLKELYGNEKLIPKKVLELLKDSKSNQLVSEILKFDGWRNSKKIAKSIKAILENQEIMKILRFFPSNYKKWIKKSMEALDKTNKNIKYVYFGSGVALSLSSMMLASNSIRRFTTNLKLKKLNLNFKSSKFVIGISSILGLLTFCSSIAMYIIFFIKEGGF